MGKTTIDPTKDREDQDADELDDEDQDADELDDEDELDEDADELDDEDESDELDDATALKALKLSPEQLKYVNSLKGKVAKANAQSAAKRRRLAELRKEARKAPAKTPETRPRRKSGELTVAEAMEQFKAEAKAERDAERLQSAAERALRNAGLALPEESGAAERKLARALKLLDLEGATPADVDDLVADLKDDEPALFKRTRKPKPRTGGVSGPARARAGTRAKDDVERALDL